LVFPFGPKNIRTVAIISGGAAPEVKEAVDKKFDVFLCGEPMEFLFNFSKDGGINVILPGHYRTEKFGIQALGELLEKKFKLDVEFIDLPCNI
jgi:putative NIF3 family GTP cyclohydrolase 1 type 2